MFPILVLISALLLAACAAFFSVTGIAALFVGASLSAGVMAASMELAKIVSVSFLYRYHRQIPKTLRAYMWIGTVVIMMITSIGIYGYLSSAYATSATDIQGKENQIILYQSMQQTAADNIARLETRNNQLLEGRAQQEARIDEYMRLGRTTGLQQRMIRDQDTEIKSNQSEIAALSKTKDSLALLATTTTNSIGTSGKIGTFYYVAKSLGVPLDTIVRWFILVLVVVFDPMSISLFLAYNVIVKKNPTAGMLPSDDKLPSEPEYIPDSSPIVDIPTPVSGIAHIVKTPEELPKQEIKEDTIPYYMKPEFDWNKDTRWHTDESAKGYWSHLGMRPRKDDT